MLAVPAVGWSNRGRKEWEASGEPLRVSAAEGPPSSLLRPLQAPRTAGSAVGHLVSVGASTALDMDHLTQPSPDPVGCTLSSSPLLSGAN